MCGVCVSGGGVGCVVCVCEGVVWGVWGVRGWCVCVGVVYRGR